MGAALCWLKTHQIFRKPLQKRTTGLCWLWKKDAPVAGIFHFIESDANGGCGYYPAPGTITAWNVSKNLFYCKVSYIRQQTAGWGILGGRRAQLVEGGQDMKPLRRQPGASWPSCKKTAALSGRVWDWHKSFLINDQIFHYSISPDGLPRQYPTIDPWFQWIV